MYHPDSNDTLDARLHEGESEDLTLNPRGELPSRSRFLKSSLFGAAAMALLGAPACAGVGGGDESDDDPPAEDDDDNRDGGYGGDDDDDG